MKQTRHNQRRQGDIQHEAVHHGDMGGVQNTQALQGGPQQNQQERRREGGENSDVEEQKKLAAGPGHEAGFVSALEAGVFIEP